MRRDGGRILTAESCTRPLDMLIIKRKDDEAIVITPQDDLDTSQTVAQLFASGPIEIKMREVGNHTVKVAIEAPPQLKIWRDAKPDTSGTDDDSA